jgi:pyruvate,water dikinase
VAGTAAGEVVCIAGPGDLRELRGKILCALRTDPGWTPLFPGCRGVIIERGSSLSHSVIVLRELGIPTIINVPGISASLRTGDRVQLDGQAGTLQRLSE